MALQNSGLTRYKRGRVTVTSRDGLQAAACECYRGRRRLTDLFRVAQAFEYIRVEWLDSNRHEEGERRFNRR